MSLQLAALLLSLVLVLVLELIRPTPTSHELHSIAHGC